MRAEAWVLGHQHVVRRLARHLVRRVPTHVELDDLIQAGMVGLLEAAQRYTDRDAATFATFAAHRIQGAMIDSLRSADWGPRSMRRRLRELDAAQRRIESATGGAATPAAIATALGVPLDRVHRTLRDAHLARLVSLETPRESQTGPLFAEPADDSPRPDEELEGEEAIEALMAGIDALTPVERTLLGLYYEQDYLMREIGVALALSESRVSQIHKRILERLRIATRRHLAQPAVSLSPGPPARARCG